MQLVFAPGYAPLSSCLCPLAAECGQFSPFPYEVPRTPRPRLLDLPPESSIYTWEQYLLANARRSSTTSPFHDFTTYPASNSIYPFNLISSNLTYQQRLALWDTGLHLPIHVHTPTAHIGVIYASNSINDCTHETLNAFEVFELLRSLACAPLELRPTFVGLQPIMQNMVRDAFYARTSGPGRTLHLAHCDAIWSRFIYGSLDRTGVGVNTGTNNYVSARVGPPASPPPPGGRPLGRDLLLGNCNLWGFERASSAGCDVVHLG